MLGVFYKSVVQAVLLFRSDKWFMTSRICRTMGLFLYQVSLWMIVKQPRRGTDGS